MTTPVVAAVFAAVFLALWWRGKMGEHVLAFAASYAFFTIGFVVTHLLPSGSVYTFHVTQLFYSLSAGAAAYGACRRVGRQAFLGTQVIIYAASATLLALAVLFSPEAGPRLLIVNTGYGVMMLVGVVSMLGVPRRNVLDTLVLIVFAVNAADFFLRPMLQLLAEGTIPVAAYRDSIYYSVINLVLMVKALTAAIVLVGACVYELIMHMRESADRDALTGLRNRRAFETDIVLPFAQAQQAGVPVSLVVADIDHFKQVNDLFGHQAGDQAIAAFGQLIESMIREHDISGRIGGEEFCVMVWDCPEQIAHRLAERIRARFAQEVIPAIGDSLRLTASFGVSTLRPGDNYDRMFGRADSALYRAKEGGRNRVEGELRDPGKSKGVAPVAARVAA